MHCKPYKPLQDTAAGAVPVAEVLKPKIIEDSLLK
jgi:hypothetical protein